MKSLFDQTSFKSAELTTRQYSTSFSSAVRLLDPSIRQEVYNIYGFVRVADEIVDTFEGHPQREILDRFEDEYRYALKHGISTDLIINAFQHTIRKYDIDLDLVDAFLKSMRADLDKKKYETAEEIAEYIYGSADVVGLMCLKIFVNGDQKKYEELKPTAMKLGSAFQKINFLRDLRHDLQELDRVYFPRLKSGNITDNDKKEILKEIRAEFDEAYEGIKKLPKNAKLGVYLAYRYYVQLMGNIENTPTAVLKEKRIRVSNLRKSRILCSCFLRSKLNLYKR